MKWNTRILQQLFPSILFTTTAEGIHLTFDDGPHPVATPAVLTILKERGIHATFFLLGQHVREYPDLAHQIRIDGHQIGNHSYTHRNLFFKKKENIRKDILQTMEILGATVPDYSKLFRPPYGYFNLTTLNVLNELGLTCVLWNINSKDYQGRDRISIERCVIQDTTNGSILLFHDNHTMHTLHTYLPMLLDTLLGKGFVFKTIPL